MTDDLQLGFMSAVGCHRMNSAFSVFQGGANAPSLALACRRPWARLNVNHLPVCIAIWHQAWYSIFQVTACGP